MSRRTKRTAGEPPNEEEKRANVHKNKENGGRATEGRKTGEPKNEERRGQGQERREAGKGGRKKISAENLKHEEKLG